MSDDDLVARVAAQILGGPALSLSQSLAMKATAADLADTIVALCREAIATEIETTGEAAQVEYDKCETFHALSPMTCSRLSEARFFARLVRRGEQQ